MRTRIRNALAQQPERLLISAALGTVYVPAGWRVLSVTPLPNLS